MYFLFHVGHLGLGHFGPSLQQVSILVYEQKRTKYTLIHTYQKFVSHTVTLMHIK